jgi:hypothetical protein
MSIQPELGTLAHRLPSLLVEPIAGQTKESRDECAQSIPFCDSDGRSMCVQFVDAFFAPLVFPVVSIGLDQPDDRGTGSVTLATASISSDDRRDPFVASCLLEIESKIFACLHDGSRLVPADSAAKQIGPLVRRTES